MREAFVIASWEWPQWIYIILTAIELGVALANSGKYIKKSSVGMTAFSAFIWFFTLSAGGFFDQIGWPQFVYFVLYIIGLAVELTDKKEYSRKSFFATLIAVAIEVFIIASGGFFR